MRPIISTMILGGTSLGTSTAKTQIGGSGIDFVLPTWTKSILAMKPVSNALTFVPDQPLITKYELETNDNLDLMPFQTLAQPLASGVANAAISLSGIQEYLAGTPCNGGEHVQAYGTNLVAYGTTAPYGQVQLVLSNMPAPYKRRHCKMGTLTTATAASDTAGTMYNFSVGANAHILELFGVHTGVAVAADKGTMGHIRYSSSEFDGIADVKLLLAPIAGVDITTSGQLVVLSRDLVDIPLKQGQVNVQDYCNLSVATTTGNFVSGVVYE